MRLEWRKKKRKDEVEENGDWRMYCDAQKYGNREGTTSSSCAAEGRKRQRNDASLFALNTFRLARSSLAEIAKSAKGISDDMVYPFIF